MSGRSAVITPRRSGRRIFAPLAVCTLALGLAVVTRPSPVAAATGGPAQASAASAMDSASAQAHRTGRPVEVADQTTENTLVMAQPDGTFVLTSTREPVRARRDGGWVPIDTTLTRRADGSVTPMAIAADVTFSGGGMQPLVRVRDGGREVALSWPDALPAPVLDGATATYGSVLPGVDLRMTATAAGYQQVLVVHDAIAASNPVLRSLRLGIAAHGLRLHVDQSGALVGSDSAGTTVFQGATPTMWDSSTSGPGAERPTGTSVGSGHVTRVPFSGAVVDGLSRDASASYLLAPPASALVGSNVTYPLYIDPTMQPSRLHYLTVHSGGWDYYDDTSEVMRVGYCGWTGCTSSEKIARSYFSFNTSPITSTSTRPTTAVIYDADVNVSQVHAAACGQPTNLWSSGSFTSSTSYGGPRKSSLMQKTSDGGCGSNSAAWVDYSNQAIIDYVQSSANNNVATTSFGLMAPDETSKYQWKKFGINPTLTVKYDFPPSAPYSLSMANRVACSGKPVYTRDQWPNLYAYAKDYNPGDVNVGLAFQILNSANSVVRYNPTVVQGATATQIGWTSSSSNSNSTAALGDATYGWQVRAYSMSPDTANAVSGWTSGADFVIDHLPPSAPTISSFDYPAGTWGATVSAPGKFTFRSSTDAAGFAYSFDNSSPALPIDTTCSYTTTPTASGGMVTASSGAATFTVPTTLPVGRHTLYVKAFDAAHNVIAGPTAGYAFYVSPSFPGQSPVKTEAEVITVTQPSGQGDPGFNGGNGYPVYVEGTSTIWSASNESHLVATAGTTAAPARFVYPFTVNLPGSYDVGLQMTLANHFGIVQFELDGNPVLGSSGPIQVDTYSASTATTYVDLGGAALTPGTHYLTVDVVGANASSVDYVYNGTYGGVSITSLHDHGMSEGIDFIQAVPLTVTFATFSDAFNNKGIAVDGSSSANIGPGPAGLGLSRQTLDAAGFASGGTATVDGVAFTMPAATNDGDNVMSGGQVISLAGPSGGTHFVDMLVASTCGNTATGPAVQLSMHFPDGDADVPMPSVPDWLTGAVPSGDSRISLAATLPYYDAGTTPNSSATPRLYHVRLALPALYDGDTLTSVTLPNVGGDFSGKCTAANLHVFALTAS